MIRVNLYQSVSQTLARTRIIYTLCNRAGSFARLLLKSRYYR